MEFGCGRLVFQRLVHDLPGDLSDERHRPSRTLLERVFGADHEVHGAFGAVHELVARRGQGVREAVVPRRLWCRCGRLFHWKRFGRVRSPDAIVLEGVILRGLRRAALERRLARWRRLRRPAEARGRVVVAAVPEVRRGAARRRHRFFAVRPCLTSERRARSAVVPPSDWTGFFATGLRRPGSLVRATCVAVGPQEHGAHATGVRLQLTRGALLSEMVCSSALQTLAVRVRRRGECKKQ